MREKIAWEQRYDVQFETRVRIVANTGFFVTKCRFTRRTATLRSEQWFAANHYLPELESPMSRRQLTLVVLTLASLAVTACGVSPTAPKHDAPIVVMGSSG
jgi:hypothetical protein